MKVLVVEIGSHTSKIGFAGEDEPRLVIPTIIGTRKTALQIKMIESVLNNLSIDISKDIYFGFEAIDRNLGLNLKQPINGPLLSNPDLLEKFLEHTLYSLNIKRPFNGYVILLYPILASEEYLTFFMDYFFKNLNVLGLCLVSQPYAALLSNDQQITGLIVEMGHEQIQILPVLKGHALKAQNTMFGGKYISDHLKQLIGSKFKSLSEPIAGVSPNLIIQDIKHNLCESNPHSKDVEDHYIFSKEFYNKKIDYLLPDRSLIHVETERFLAPEVLFQPELVGKDESLPQLIIRCIDEVEPSLRNIFFNNIFLSGGSVDINNIDKRLTAELSLLVSPSIKIRVRKITNPSSYNSWRGASKLGTIEKFPLLVLKATDYLSTSLIEMNKTIYPTFEKIQIVPPPIHVFLKPIPKTYSSRMHKLIINFVEKSEDGILYFDELAEFFNKSVQDIIKTFITLLAEGKIDGNIDEEKRIFIREGIDKFQIRI